MLVAAIFTALIAENACAQSSRATIVTAPAVWVAPSTEMPLVVQLDTAAVMPAQAMLVVRGLPPTVTLTEGRPFGPGVWVVPVAMLPRLRVRAPAQTSRSELSLSLVSLDGTSLAEARLMLLVEPPVDTYSSLPTAAPPTVLRPDPPNTAAPPLLQLTPEERASAVMLMDRGLESIRAGNVVVAQKFYQRAAERGLAEAALALAGTYDARELARLKLDVEPNPALARQWYEKARELGSREAELRLRQLR